MFSLKQIIVHHSLSQFPQLCANNCSIVRKLDYEEERPTKISVTRSLEDKEVEVTSIESILEIIWKRNGKIIYDPQFPADKITEIKEYLEGLMYLPLTRELKTQVADFLTPYLQFLE